MPALSYFGIGHLLAIVIHNQQFGVQPDNLHRVREWFDIALAEHFPVQDKIASAYFPTAVLALRVVD